MPQACCQIYILLVHRDLLDSALLIYERKPSSRQRYNVQTTCLRLSYVFWHTMRFEHRSRFLFLLDFQRTVVNVLLDMKQEIRKLSRGPIDFPEVRIDPVNDFTEFLRMEDSLRDVDTFTTYVSLASQYCYSFFYC